MREEITDIVERYWHRVSKDKAWERFGGQLINGQWYLPEYGCDSLNRTLIALQDRFHFVERAQ